MNRSEILSTADQAVSVDRDAAYGGPERNFAAIAGLWSEYLGEEIGCADVAAMMILLKLARMKSNPSYEDNWVDIAGYAACGGEITTKARRSKPPFFEATPYKEVDPNP